MAKYSKEEKEEAVRAYLKGEGGYRYVAKKYEVEKRMLQQWVKTYQQIGSAGLARSRKNAYYSFEFKLKVVELYLSTEVSYLELALSQGINNSSIVARWVIDYRTAGPDALRPKLKGRQPKMSKPKTKPLPHAKPSSDNAEYVRQLENELLKLKIENAYLKELRRLNLEATPQNKKRESSTASVKFSN